MEDSPLLFALCRTRWMTALMAAFAGAEGLRVAELLVRTGAPRDSLARTIELACQQGWLLRNSGYGHPLRPEVLLSEAGQAVAQRAFQLEKAIAQAEVRHAALTRWSVPTLVMIDQGAYRFNALRRALAPATPRALSQTLHALVGDALVHRDIVDAFPPVSAYRLTERGTVIARA